MSKLGECPRIHEVTTLAGTKARIVNPNSLCEAVSKLNSSQNGRANVLVSHMDARSSSFVLTRCPLRPRTCQTNSAASTMDSRAREAALAKRGSSRYFNRQLSIQSILLNGTAPCGIVLSTLASKSSTGRKNIDTPKSRPSPTGLPVST